MKRQGLVISCSIAALAGCSSPRYRAENPGAAAQFERLKSLAGSWSAASEAPDAELGAGPVTTTYEVTSGGHALVETEFVGSEHEMLTVYALEHGQLALRHDCTLGNRPHMLAAPSSDRDVIRFTCDGGEIDGAREQHMHEEVIHFLPGGGLRADRTMWQDGRPAETVGFVSTRR
jgi:hypothetical protein